MTSGRNWATRDQGGTAHVALLIHADNYTVRRAKSTNSRIS